MKSTGNISKILEKVREEYTSVPKYLIHNALDDAAAMSDDKFDKTMSTIINAVMIAAPKKKQRVGFTILEYCAKEDKQLNDKQYTDLIDCFVSNNYYMKCMYTNHELYDIFSSVYFKDKDKMREALDKSIGSLGKSDNYNQCLSSRTKVITFASTFLLYSKIDHKDAVDLVVSKKSDLFLMNFLLQIVQNDDLRTDGICFTIRKNSGGYTWLSTARFESVSISEKVTKAAPITDIIKYAVDTHLVNMPSDSVMISKCNPLVERIGYKKKVVFIDTEGNIVGA